MDLFLLSAGIFALSAVFAALSGERPYANALGAGGACLGCLVGLLSLFSENWGTTLLLTLPWGLPFGSFAVGLDPLTRLFLLPSFSLGALCALSGAAALSHSPPHEHNLGAHWAFYNLLLLGLSLVPAARDAVLFMLAWELMSLAPFFLIDFYDNEAHVREASWIYLTAAHLGAVCLIGMFGALWAQTGTTAFSDFASEKFAAAAPSLLFIPALLGFGAKAGFAPLHVWLPEAHPAAPSHISALLSGAMINAGIYGLARFLNLFGGQGESWWGPLLLIAGTAGALIGILKALGQSELKRLLAYSSVENMGIILISLGAAVTGAHAGLSGIAALGFAAAFLHTLNHSAVKGLMFLSAGEVLHGAHTAHLEHLGGLRKRMPSVSAVFALGAASLAGLPPFTCFAGEFLLMLALFTGHMSADVEHQVLFFGALASLALIGGLAAATFAKAYGTAFLGEARSGAAGNAEEPGKLSRLCLLLFALCCLALALGAPFLFDRIVYPAVAGMLKPCGIELFLQQADRFFLFELSWPATLLARCTVTGLCLLAGVFLLLLLRRALLGREGTRSSGTWACGYGIASPRIQYSALSFVEPLAGLFSAVMGLTRRHVQWGTFFPSRMLFEIRIADRLLTGFFTPLFEGLRRLCDALKILQHGKIHLYILYIFITAAALLVWGAWS
jgi:formate hydrogenlyase subunit 3/multisubunit Na+/H+ antiporter MnhD subunit